MTDVHLSWPALIWQGLGEAVSFPEGTGGVEGAGEGDITGLFKAVLVILTILEAIVLNPM
jgi:hypothetical protein